MNPGYCASKHVQDEESPSLPTHLSFPCIFREDGLKMPLIIWALWGGDTAVEGEWPPMSPDDSGHSEAGHNGVLESGSLPLTSPFTRWVGRWDTGSHLVSGCPGSDSSETPSFRARRLAWCPPAWVPFGKIVLTVRFSLRAPAGRWGLFWGSQARPPPKASPLHATSGTSLLGV